jgi:hypothetical protein
MKTALATAWTVNTRGVVVLMLSMNTFVKSITKKETMIINIQTERRPSQLKVLIAGQPKTEFGLKIEPITERHVGGVVHFQEALASSLGHSRQTKFGVKIEPVRCCPPRRSDHTRQQAK